MLHLRTEELCHRVRGRRSGRDVFNRGVAVPQMLGMVHGIVSVAPKCTVSTCVCRRQLVAWVGFLHRSPLPRRCVCLHVFMV